MRTDVQKTLDALREAGSRGIHSFDLNKIVGTTRSAARVNDLINLGYNIESQQRVKKGDSWGAVYTLLEDSQASTVISQPSSQPQNPWEVDYVRVEHPDGHVTYEEKQLVI